MPRRRGCARGAGMPPDVNQYDNTLMEDAEALAGRWHQADPERDGSLPDPVSASDVEGWAPDTLSAFASKLGQFTAAKPLTTAATRAIGTTYKLDSMRNPEVRNVFLQAPWPTGAIVWLMSLPWVRVRRQHREDWV